MLRPSPSTHHELVHQEAIHARALCLCLCLSLWVEESGFLYVISMDRAECVCVIVWLAGRDARDAETTSKCLTHTQHDQDHDALSPLAVLGSFIDWFLLLLVARCLLAWCVPCLVSRV